MPCQDTSTGVSLRSLPRVLVVQQVFWVSIKSMGPMLRANLRFSITPASGCSTAASRASITPPGIFSLNIPNDNLLLGFRQRAGLPASGSPLIGWYGGG